MSDDDLRWQLSLIAGSFDVRSANLGGDPATASEAFGDIEPLGDDALLTVAVDLANEIEAKAFRQSNGDLGWMVLHYSPAAERYTLQPMENDLYNGRAGVGLFFAALEKFLPGSAYRALAHGSLKPVRRWIKAAPDTELTEFGFGGYAGLASIAYALTKAGQFLAEDDLVADAAIAARRPESDQIEQDDSLDAMSGAAGAIPALLACSRRDRRRDNSCHRYHMRPPPPAAARARPIRLQDLADAGKTPSHRIFPRRRRHRLRAFAAIQGDWRRRALRGGD